MLGLLCFTGIAFFFFPKLKARPPTSEKITTHFIAILTLLWWSATEPAISLSCACITSRFLAWGVRYMVLSETANGNKNGGTHYG